MKALCLLPKVSRSVGVATSKASLWPVLSDASAVGLMGTRRGCQRCDELMALNCANQADIIFIFFFSFAGDDGFI